MKKLLLILFSVFILTGCSHEEYSWEITTSEGTYYVKGTAIQEGNGKLFISRIDNLVWRVTSVINIPKDGKYTVLEIFSG